MPATDRPESNVSTLVRERRLLGGVDGGLRHRRRRPRSPRPRGSTRRAGRCRGWRAPGAAAGAEPGRTALHRGRCRAAPDYAPGRASPRRDSPRTTRAATASACRSVRVASLAHATRQRHARALLHHVRGLVRSRVQVGRARESDGIARGVPPWRPWRSLASAAGPPTRACTPAHVVTSESTLNPARDAGNAPPVPATLRARRLRHLGARPGPPRCKPAALAGTSGIKLRVAVPAPAYATSLALELQAERHPPRDDPPYPRDLPALQLEPSELTRGRSPDGPSKAARAALWARSASHMALAQVGPAPARSIWPAPTPFSLRCGSWFSRSSRCGASALRRPARGDPSRCAAERSWKVPARRAGKTCMWRRLR